MHVIQCSARKDNFKIFNICEFVTLSVNAEEDHMVESFGIKVVLHLRKTSDSFLENGCKERLLILFF